MKIKIAEEKFMKTYHMFIYVAQNEERFVIVGYKLNSGDLKPYMNRPACKLVLGDLYIELWKKTQLYCGELKVQHKTEAKEKPRKQDSQVKIETSVKEKYNKETKCGQITCSS